jgi:hypothetical protein
MGGDSDESDGIDLMNMDFSAPAKVAAAKKIQEEKKA